jgi:hypothetical protein
MPSIYSCLCGLKNIGWEPFLPVFLLLAARAAAGAAAFLCRRLSTLDQLADLLSAFPADLLVEALAIALLGRGTSLLAADLAALLADLLVETFAIALFRRGATFVSGLSYSHFCLFLSHI